MPDDQLKLPPPGAESDKAQSYVETLSTLIAMDKVKVSQTDLSRFNSTSMEDHYRIDLNEYDAEISHNRNPETGEETFILIFNSVNRFDLQNPKPIILSYLRLSDEQFLKLKQSCDGQLERGRKAAEEERFKATMGPVDQLLNQLASGSAVTPQAEPLSNPQEDQATTAVDEDSAASAQNSFDDMPSISEYSKPDLNQEESNSEQSEESKPEEVTSP